MLKQAKSNASKFIAGFMAVLLLLNMIPVGIISRVFAAPVEAFTVKMPEKVSATITMTDDNDAEKVFTANTDKKFEAVLENLDDETTYTLVVSGMEIYKDYTKTGVVIDASSNLEILETDLSEKDAQSIAFAEESITKTYGSDEFVVSLANPGLGTGLKSYSSSKETVAKIDSNGKITIMGVGTTEIKVVIASDGTYKTAEDTLILTVEQADNAISYEATSVNWMVKDKKTNELTKKDGAVGNIKYTSDDTSVARVNGKTGEVTILKPGNAKITATFVAGTGSNYKDSSASYTITASKKANALFFEAVEINKTYGDVDVNPIKPDDIDGTITFESDNEAVAIVDSETGEYRLVGVGTAKITAKLADDDNNYDSTSASYILNVAKKEQALSFANELQTYTYGDDIVVNELAVACLELNGFVGPVTYESNAPEVVSVDSVTGAITILKAGDATITASIDEEENYAQASAEYTVQVQKKEIDFVINKTINIGEKDPDLSDDIRKGVIDALVSSEQENEEIINRVVGCISYTYPTVDDEELRPEGDHVIDFECTNNDNYAFELRGTLTVKDPVECPKDEDSPYTISGLNQDNWGSVNDKVKILVNDQEKYRISTSTQYRQKEWLNTELVYNEAGDMDEHTFYIRDIQTGKVYKASKYFGIDGTNPAIGRFDFNVEGDTLIEKAICFLTFGTFCNQEVNVTVTASDSYSDSYSDSQPTSGIDTITLYYDNEQEEKTQTQQVNKDNKATFTLSVDEFETLKTLSARATDKVGNESEMTFVTSKNSDFKQVGNGMLQLEATLAQIEVHYAEATSKNETEKWYGEDIQFDVKVEDKGDGNSGIRAIWAVINTEKVEINEFTDRTGAPLTPYDSETKGVRSGKEAYYFIDKKTEVVNFTINTNLVDIPDDGEYVVEVFAVDNAGNQASQQYSVNIDREAPIITGFEFIPTENTTDSKEGEPVATVETYGYFFNQDANVIVTAKDIRPSAGVHHIEFYTIDEDGTRKDYTSVFTNEVNREGNEKAIIETASFTIPKGFKGQIYARAVDNVEHTTLNEDKTPKYFNPNGTAIEDKDIHMEHSAASITLVDNTTYCDCKGLPLYKWVADSEETVAGIPVKLYVKDSFSGINSITWKVTAPYNATDEDPKGEITVEDYLNSPVEVGYEIGGWTVEAVDKNLVTEMSKVIYVTNNSNAISVELSFNDRALNSSMATPLYFSIDNTNPKIEVAYDEKEVHDSTNTDFFSTDRTATITITERNFRASDVEFAITNTDKVIPNVDLTDDKTWTKTVDESNPDKTTYVAKIPYTADGDYTFDISYKDNAENPANTVAQHKFTIDKTVPTVAVSYDNMSAMNGNYYKAARTATITIKEHNFDASRVNVIGVATDNGAASRFPVTSAWRDNGNDTHTATIAYTADSKYTFDIEFHDMANNSIADYTPEEFYVDKTAPNLSITGVADQSANNGDVAPVITFTDTNFNKDAVTITLSGVNNGRDLKYAGSYNNIANGQTYTYANFEKVQSVDDIYTLTARLTDKAGNQTEKTITFSANRFGSVYSLENVEDIIGKYLQNEQDIVFTETNVDSLDRKGIKIKLTKNGMPTDLVEGKDYTIEASGGNGQWSVYKYTVKKALFADDGRYSISIYSKDAAGNVNENIDETKTAEISFGIDKTNPVIVPINLKSDVQYAVDMKTVSVEIKDNLVLEDVKIYLNGKEIEYTVEGETYTFDIPKDSSKQDVKIVAIDAAGNEEPVEITDFLVNANIFVRWYNNTALFVGSIIGVVVIALGITGFIVFGKKKKEE